MYAVFENDGLYDIYQKKDEAKAVAAKLRENHRLNGYKPNAHIHKLTNEEKKYWCN